MNIREIIKLIHNKGDKSLKVKYLIGICLSTALPCFSDSRYKTGTIYSAVRYDDYEDILKSKLFVGF
ncbi:MAG: hypothetical protein M3R36_12450 [Bacteroidota bacterium]|nr:hypothetical protein [Bacteroidota bacterium]